MLESTGILVGGSASRFLSQNLTLLSYLTFSRGAFDNFSQGEHHWRDDRDRNCIGEDEEGKCVHDSLHVF